jgi:ABC-type multidrug transport system ATPase subunit
MNDSGPILEARKLVKRFGATPAVNGLDLSVRRGDLYGLVGLNGAGKTTTLRMLMGLIAPDTGSFIVRGEATTRIRPRHRARIAALIETPSLFHRLSGLDNVLAIARLSAPVTRRDAEEQLARVGLHAHQHRPAGDYSLGMKQRLALAVALAASPEILVLDEPTNGLDPEGIRDLRDALVRLNAAGMTVLVSSHLLSEVERFATRIGVVRAGRMVVEGTIANALGDGGELEIVADPFERAAEIAARFGAVRHEGTTLFVRAEPPDAAALNRALVDAGVAVHAIALRRRTLEDLVVGVEERV